MPGTDLTTYEPDSDILFPSASEFVVTLLAYTDSRFDEEIGAMTYLDKLSVNLPIELQIHESEEALSGLSLRMSAPTQRTLTSVYPVLHNIQMVLGTSRQ